jgi:hypothetical protein
MRRARRNAKHHPFLTAASAFYRSKDSLWRKFDSGHRPFIARPSKRVMIDAEF